MAHDVFISYAEEDKSVADAVCQALEDSGIRCWYAPRNVPYAIDYEEALIDAISESKLMLLILSAASNNSMHVKREVQNACREDPQIPVLPFQIENISLNKALRYYIGSVHWLSALTLPLTDHLQKLVEYVQSLLLHHREAEKTARHAEEERQQREEEERRKREATELNRQREESYRDVREPIRKLSEPMAAQPTQQEAQKETTPASVQTLPPATPPPLPGPPPSAVNREARAARKSIYKDPSTIITIVAAVIVMVILILVILIVIQAWRTDKNGNQPASESQESSVPQSSAQPADTAKEPTPFSGIVNSNVSKANNSNITEPNTNNSNRPESNANNSNTVESNVNIAQDSERKRIIPVSATATPEGSRITITSDGALSDYSAYRSGDRYYVLIPEADASRLVNGLRGRGFEDVRMQKRGNDVLVSFRLLNGASARIEQRFNQLIIIVTVPALAAGNVQANSNNVNVGKKKPKP